MAPIRESLSQNSTPRFLCLHNFFQHPAHCAKKQILILNRVLHENYNDLGQSKALELVLILCAVSFGKLLSHILSTQEWVEYISTYYQQL